MHPAVLKMMPDEASRHHATAGDEYKRVADACPGLLAIFAGPGHELPVSDLINC